MRVAAGPRRRLRIRPLHVLLTVLMLGGAGTNASGAGSIRLTDTVLAGLLAAWWLSGGRVDRSGRLTRVAALSLSLMILGLSAVRGIGDAVLLARVCLAPLLVVVVIWYCRRFGAEQAVRTIAISTVLLSGLVLLPAILNLGAGSVEPSAQIDRMLSTIFPRDDAGFVYTAGNVIRSRGPFGHPNEAGGVLAVLTVAAIGWARLPGRRLLMAIAAIAGGLGVLVTGSRSAYAALLMGVALNFVLGMGRSSRSTQRLVRVCAILMLAVGILLAAPAGGDATRESYVARFESGLLSPQSDASVNGRFESASLGISSIIRNPVGIGLSRFDQNLGSVHNSTLYLTVVFGVPFGVAVVLLIIYLGRRSWDVARRSSHSQAGLVGRGAAVAALTWLVLTMTEDRPQSPSTMVLGALMFSLAGVRTADRPAPPLAPIVHTGKR